MTKNKLNEDLVIELAMVMRRNTFTKTNPSGTSENRFCDTTVAFSEENMFSSLSTVIDGTVYAAFPDLVPFKIVNSRPEDLTADELTLLENHLQAVVEELF